MKSLKEIVGSLRDCGYNCEAGPLENNVDFQLLAQLAGLHNGGVIEGAPVALHKDFVIPRGHMFNPHLIRIKKSPQQQRDEIVDQAKCDVAELSTTWRPGCPGLNYGPSAFDPEDETVNFSINHEKRTVVCYITYWSVINQRTQISFRGIAKCDPTDCFNVHIGKAIALRRALGLEVPDEYLNAPQPTEVRVGDVVNGAKFDSYYKPNMRFTLTREHGTESFYYAESKTGDYIFRKQIGAIIDDSREEVDE